MPQFGVRKEIEFDAGHRVPDHDGQCRNLHGHRYAVALSVRGYIQEEGAATGMVLDFSDIKRCLQQIHDTFDHGFIVYEHDELVAPLFQSGGPLARMKCTYLHVVPTAENLAKWCYDFAIAWFAERKLPGTVTLCEVFETPTSLASYPV